MQRRKFLSAQTILPIGLVVGLILLIIAFIFVACPFLWLRIINAFDPMQLAFLESFQIENRSGQYLEVVPIGMFEGTGLYGPLPLYRNTFPPAIPLPTSQTISIASGNKTRVTYDYDDVNFRHILIRDKTGHIYILDTDKKGTKQACYGPQKDIYTIPPVDQLQIAQSELIQCFYGHKVSYSDAKEYP
jgi:hypothetical protein